MSREREIDGYVRRFTRLVEMEREEEMRRHEEEIRRLSGPERESRGRAILGLKGRDEGKGLGGYHVKYTRAPEPLPDTEIGVGDLAAISKGDPLNYGETATVIEKTNYSITIAFDQRPPEWAMSRNLRLDLYVNDITFQRMLDALQSFQNNPRPVLLGQRKPQFGPTPDIKEYNEVLDESQQTAVSRCLSARDFFLVHGPPGTGKTTTLVEVIQQLVGRGEKVLATADSNVAVDNIVERLAENNVRVVRVGHPARVTPALREHTLDLRVEDNPSYRSAQKIRERAYDLLEDRDELTRPSGRWRRGLSNKQIKEYASRGRGTRGIPAEKIREMAAWIEIQERVDKLFDEVDRLEQKAIDEILNEADVVCTTNSTAGSEIMAGREFDSLIIDEATQATEPACLIPITNANPDRLILAGDHKQLPPTILNEDARGLRETMFERLLKDHGDRVHGMLRVQYRMHEDIMRFPSQHFYQGRVIAHESVARHTLAGLPHVDRVEEGRPSKNTTCPLVFIDTRGRAPEHTRRGSTSKENHHEAEAVVETVDGLLEAGVRPEEIAVISPYDDQVDRLRGMISVDDLEVNTVDGFQGREKEAIVVSFVRSNPNNEIGFLADLRRLNVSITRARRKLVMIGDSKTLYSHRTYAELIDHVKEHGEYVEAPQLRG